MHFWRSSAATRCRRSKGISGATWSRWRSDTPLPLRGIGQGEGGDHPAPAAPTSSRRGDMIKVMSMADAIDRFVPSGSTVAMGTALEALIPFAAGHEMIRQGRRDLELVGPISDSLFDQLIGAGSVRRITAAWVGNVSEGLGYCYRRAAEQGIPRSIEVHDHTNFSISMALWAAAWNVPYLPTD